MWPESSDKEGAGTQPAPLRTGLTTGSCATACCVAAATFLFSQSRPAAVSISLPAKPQTKKSAAAVAKAKQVEMAVFGYQPLANNRTGAEVSTIKDAGDDPDITHGARVFVQLSLTSEPGVQFHAAEGVGTVTREGLALAVGEPAINPTPRKMMAEHLQRLAQFYSYKGGFDVAVGVENGAQLALKTMNPKLGILGGLSILGTTGIVRPFSCAAWIASIHQGIDVAASNGSEHIIASTGNQSEQAAQAMYQLDDMAHIEMGDFAGAVLKHVRTALKNSTETDPYSIEKLTICGGFGKLTKLAAGHMDLNSRASKIDLNFVAELAAHAGADQALQQEIIAANTSIAALKLCQQQGIDLAYQVCQQVWQVCADKLKLNDHPDFTLEILAINRQGQLVGQFTGQAAGQFPR